MYKIACILLFMAMTAPINAQFNILFVDDSADTFENAEELAATLDSLGYEYTYYDAIGQNVSPLASEMSEYDLVIWYTSSWGLDLQLWGGGDSTNHELVEYLAQPDANVWLIGLDYFFDKYGLAPVTFQTGDFAYDYLGISGYLIQSFADDGSLGVPLVTPAPGQPISGLEDITWEFSTLWYADGFELRPEATPVYLFGDSDYILNGFPTGAWFHPAGGARVLTYGFDLALAADFELMRTHVATVLNWWEDELSSTESPAIDPLSVKISPNLFTDRLEIRIKTQETTPVSVLIYDTNGQLAGQVAEQEMVWPGEEKVLYWKAQATLPDGIYYCNVQTGQQLHTVKLVKLNR